METPSTVQSSLDPQDAILAIHEREKEISSKCLYPEVKLTRSRKLVIGVFIVLGNSILVRQYFVNTEYV